MATRLKTIEFGIPQLASLPDNTLTAMDVITMYIPEFSGTVTFRKVVVEVSVNDASTTLGNFQTRRIDVSVGGATATSYSNGNLYTGSGEQTMVFFAADCTSHFSSNWTSGTSKTLALSVLLDSLAASGIIFNTVGATIYITYEYDDQQPTQIKTVRIPLNAPVGALETTKPGTATATIPALDTELPEASKTYRNMFTVVQGNVNNTASTTDSTLSSQIETYTAYASGTLEMGATSDYWARFIHTFHYYNSGGTAAGIGMDTSVTRNWYLWASVARHNHQQAWLVVTYEFDATQSNACFVSLMMPMELSTPMGGTTSSDYQRARRDLFIPEPGTITTKQIAFFSTWEQSAAISGLNMRVGTGSFVTYTDASAVLCGSNGAMTRNDGAFSLAHGENLLTWDVYRTDTSDLGYNLSGFWIINYTCSKPTQGYGAANHTVLWNVGATFDGAVLSTRVLSAVAPVIPEADYYMNSIGLRCLHVTNTTLAFYGISIDTERLSAEGGVAWDSAYADVGWSDAESGLHLFFAQASDVFKRWPTELTPGKLDLETSRRWRVTSNGAAGFNHLDLMLTYHTITFSSSGVVSGYADADGAGLTVTLHRVDTGEQIASATTTTGGNYTLTWYQDISVFASCAEDATHVGRGAAFTLGT